MSRFILLLLLPVVAYGQSWTTIQTGSASLAGASATFELQIDTSTVSPTLNRVRFVVTVTGSTALSPNAEYAIWNGGYGIEYLGGNTITTFPTTHTGPNRNMTGAGQKYGISLRMNAPGYTSTPAENYIEHVFDAAWEPDFYFDCIIPANATDRPVIYKVFQNGVEKASVTQAAGAGQQTLHLTNVDEEGLITVVAYTGAYVMSSGTPSVPVWTDAQKAEVVGGGNSTNASEPPEPTALLTPQTPLGANNVAPTPQVAPTAPTPPTAPANPTPSTAPATPTSTTPQATPTGNSNPYTPSGATAVTKENLEDAINKLIQDGNSTRNLDASNTNKIIESVDKAAASENESAKKLITAVDSLSSKNKETLDTVRTAITQQTTLLQQTSATNTAALNTANLQLAMGFGGMIGKLDGIKQEVSAGNTLLEEIATKLEEKKNPTPEALAAMVSEYTTAAAASANDAESLWNARAVPSTEIQPATTSAGSMFLWTVMGREINLDPLARWPWLFAWVKFILAWLIAAAFCAWLWTYYPQLQHDILTAGPAKVNTQALTGAAPIIGGAIAAGITTLIVTSCLAAPVALFAVADSGPYGLYLSTLTDDPRSALGAPTNIKDAILYLLDACFPVNTGLTAIVEYFIIKKAGTIIATGVQMFIRALPI